MNRVGHQDDRFPASTQREDGSLEQRSSDMGIDGTKGVVKELERSIHYDWFATHNDVGVEVQRSGDVYPLFLAYQCQILRRSAKILTYLQTS